MSISLKKDICDKAYELILLLDSLTDEDFVDEIIDCVRYGDSYALSEIRERV